MNHTPCRNCGKNKLKGRCLCIPRSFWERDETREAVASGDVCRVIRLLRRHTNLTQEAIANLCGLTQSMVSRLESGERTLRDAQRRSQVLEALGAPAVNQQDPSPAASALTVDEQDRLAYALAHPSRLDGPAVTAFTQVLAAQRRLEDAVGSAAVLPGIAAQLATLVRLLPDVRGPHRDAYAAVVAEWTQFTGWLHAALRRDRTALDLFGRAEELADDAGKPTLAASAVSFRGYMARQQGRPQAVIRASQAALHTPGIHPAQRTFDTLQAAQGYAAFGDTDTARRLLDTATTLVEIAAAAGEPPSFAYWYRPAFFQLNIGLVYLELGEYATAADLLSAGLNGLPSDQQRAEWTAEYRASLTAARAGVSVAEQ